MNALVLPDARLAEWDALVRCERTFAMLQSAAWGAFKARLGWNVWRVAVEQDGKLLAGAQLLVKPLALGLSLAYVPRGPIGQWATPEVARLLFAELCRLARSRGAVFLKIEPPATLNDETGRLLEACGFRHTQVNNQPQATIILDLQPGEHALLRDMRKKTRQYVRRAQREGITVRIGDERDLPLFHDLMRRTAQREHFAARSLHYYQSEWQAFTPNDGAALLLAYHQDRLVAARLVYRHGAHAAEFHAGSEIIPGLHANYLLVWEAIRWACAHGCLTYDLWGIPDEIAATHPGEQPPCPERDDGLWGVYQFKRGFGTNVVSYLGAYDYVFVPALYRLLDIILSRGKWWERIAARLDLPRLVLSPRPNLDVSDGKP